jgi:hypothetical protein
MHASVPFFATGAGMVAAHKLRARDFVPAGEHEEAAAQLAAAKEQLVEAMEELASRDRELTEVGAFTWPCLLLWPGLVWHGHGQRPCSGRG